MYIIFHVEFDSNGNYISTEFIADANYNHSINTWNLTLLEEPPKVKVFYDEDSFMDIVKVYTSSAKYVVGKKVIGEQS